MGFAGRPEYRFDVADGEILHGLYSMLAAVSAANNLHHGGTAGERDVLFVSQRLDQHAL